MIYAIKLPQDIEENLDEHCGEIAHSIGAVYRVVKIFGVAIKTQDLLNALNALSRLLPHKSLRNSMI